MANMDDAIEMVTEKDIAALQALVAMLAGRDRKARQNAAHTISQVAKAMPVAIVPFVDEVVAAIDRPEAQTRWEVLDALTSMVAADPDAAALGFEGAENSLYDEESGLVRLTAFRYFTTLGGSSAAWSVQTWPLIDEAIQCYHGDPEFDEMLDSLYLFAQTDLDESVRKSLAERMRFDAHSGKGALAARARQIIEVIHR